MIKTVCKHSLIFPVLLALLCGMTQPVIAKQQKSVLFFVSKNQQASETLVQAFEQQLANISNLSTKLVIRYMEETQPHKLRTIIQSDYDLIISIGFAATKKLLNIADKQNILAMYLYHYQARILRQQFNHINFSVLLLDQPKSRQLAVIKAIQPQAKQIGALFGPYTQYSVEQWQADMQKSELHLNFYLLNSRRQPEKAMSQIQKNSDVLLAIPDSFIFNPDHLQGLLMVAFRSKKMLFGYTKAMGQAGAIASLYSTASQLGRQAAKWWLTNGFAANNEMLYPQEYHLNLNYQVARNFDITLPEKNKIQQLIKQTDTN